MTPPLQYGVYFTDNTVEFILATDLEEAAWTAIDLAFKQDKTVKDIIPAYVKQILSEQMETSQEPT